MSPVIVPVIVSGGAVSNAAAHGHVGPALFQAGGMLGLLLVLPFVLYEPRPSARGRTWLLIGGPAVCAIGTVLLAWKFGAPI